MRVIAYGTSSPVSDYRLRWPAEAMAKAGYDVQFLNADDPNTPIRQTKDRHGSLVDVTIPDCDIIVLQRVTELNILEAMVLWRQAGIRVIVDMDDDLRHVTPSQNPGAFTFLNRQERIHWRYSDEACKMADRVIVSTGALQRLYGGMVVRNRIPETWLTVPRYTGIPVVGWTGALGFRQDDPSVVGGAIARLQREGYEFGLVGPPDGIGGAFHLIREPIRSGAAPHNMYPLRMSAFTVGIAPVKLSRFNEAKSWLKPLQFMALGVPCVASPTPEYELLDGIVYASNPRRWYSTLKHLLSDADYREARSAEGRAIAARYTVESAVEFWATQWLGEW